MRPTLAASAATHNGKNLSYSGSGASELMDESVLPHGNKLPRCRVWIYPLGIHVRRPEHGRG